MSAKQTSILGFKCTLENPRLRRIVRQVLTQIKKRAPEDHERLRSGVVGIDPLSAHETEDGTVGHTISVRPNDYGNLVELWRSAPSIEEAARISSLQDPRNWPKCVRLWDGPYDDGTTDSALRALVAHELGHVTTTSEDVESRESQSDEWATEACAERYAYKWGFGRDCAKARKHRQLAHHGPGPGQVIEMYGRRYRMTRSFHLREVD